MKKLLAFVMLLGLLVVSCTPESINESNEQSTDKNKICPPSNPNCNG